MYQPFDTETQLPVATEKILTPQEIRTQEHYDLLCQTIAENTKSLASIVATIREQRPDFPSIAKIYQLLRDDETFSAQYSRAKEDQAELMAQEMLTICDDISGDAEGGNVAVQRAKLQVETRKFLASKLKPKVYGDKADRLAIAVQVNTAEYCPFNLSDYS